MRRALIALLLLLLAAALALVRRPSPLTGPVYTVAQVAAGLANQPQAWAGHTVTVRGTLVLVEWAIQHGGVYVGPGRAGCADATHCALHVPTNTWLDVFLVGQVPRGRAADAHLLRSLAAARATAPATPTGSPPSLVVEVLPQRVRLQGALLHVVPRPLLEALMQAPVIGYTLAPVATVQGGTPRPYRIALWTNTMPYGTCAPACEDGDLLDTL